MRDPGFPVNEAAPMVHANKQFVAMPQIFPQHPQPMDGYYNHVNEIQDNYAMSNGVDHLLYHGVIPSVGLQQPNGEGFFSQGHQVPQNFVRQSNGPNIFPGQAVINFGNHFYQGHGMMPNSIPQQEPIIDPLNQQGMVRHLNGHIYPAADVWQNVLDGDKKESQAAKQADQARMERNRLGDFTPPRAVRPDKRRFHEHNMSQHFKQEDVFDDASFNRQMTPAQRRDSMVSNSMSSSLSTPEKFTFEAPSTLENFKHPGRKSDLPMTESPSKRQKTSGLKRNPSCHQGRTVASSIPVPDAAVVPGTAIVPAAVVSPCMPPAGPAKLAPMATPGPPAPSIRSVPAPTVLLEMPAPDQITAPFKPVSGPPISFSISAPGSSPGSFVPESDPPVMYLLALSGHTASASMSGSRPPVSCSMDVPSPAAPASIPASGSAMRDGAHPAAPQSPSADAATLDVGSRDQDSDRMSEENDLLLVRFNAANAGESIATSLPAQEQRSLQPHNSAVAEDSVQEGFLPAGNPDVRPPVFGEGEFLSPNYGLEDQNSPSNVPSPLVDAGVYDDIDQEQGEYNLDVSYS